MEANMPSAQDCPESLSQLTFQNGTPVRRDPDLRNDVARLVKALERVLE